MSIILKMNTHAKWMIDGAAATTALAHFWGLWAGHVAAIASTAALLWICVQAFFFVKDRFFK
jgi:hypothetical protein